MFEWKDFRIDNINRIGSMTTSEREIEDLVISAVKSAEYQLMDEMIRYIDVKVINATKEQQEHIKSFQKALLKRIKELRR